MRPATLIGLAGRAGHRLPAQFYSADRSDLASAGWPRFQRLYDMARNVIADAATLRRVVLEIAEDNRAAGVRWVELQVDPSPYATLTGGVASATELLLEVLASASRETGVGMALIIAANRTRSLPEAMTTARLACRYARGAGLAGDVGVVGLGLSNDEARGPTANFIRPFRLARDAGLLCVPHAGETVGAASVLDAVELLGADRIGHGVRAVEDLRVLELLATRHTVCEVCPASNLALGVARHERDVPLRELRNAGVPVVLGADDPLLFRAGLIEQYVYARDHGDAGPAELAGYARTSFEASAAPAALVHDALEDIARWEAAF